MRKLLLLMLLLIGETAFAETFVYVHGWTPNGRNYTNQCNNQSHCSYWKEQLPGEKNVYVGWNTGVDWRYGGVWNAQEVFNANCKSDSCVVICHSTGCPVTGRALDLYGASEGWRITRVLALGSAEGGTELAESESGGGYLGQTLMALGNIGYELASDFDGTLLSQAIDPDIQFNATSIFLRPNVVREAYNHDDTAGAAVFHVAGYDGTAATSWILKGQDDGVVPFHSACGYVMEFHSTQCSNDWHMVWRKTWYGLKYVKRTAAQWANHRRVEYCGRDGCDKNHAQLMQLQFQQLAKQATP